MGKEGNAEKVMRDIRRHPDTTREIIIAGRSFFPSTIEDVLAEL